MDKFNNQIRTIMTQHLSDHAAEVRKRQWNGGFPFVVKDEPSSHDYPSMLPVEVVGHLNHLYTSLVSCEGCNQDHIDKFMNDQIKFLSHMKSGLRELKYLIPIAENKKDKSLTEIYKLNLKKKHQLIDGFEMFLKQMNQEVPA